MADDPAHKQSDDGNIDPPTVDSHAPLSFRFLVFVVFGWIIIGISFIYGYRLWWDAPLHPSFVPFIGVCFAVVVAFVIVLTLKYTTGEDIELEVPGLKLKGASGPIILWAVCFLSIAFGLYLLGVTEIFKSTEEHKRLPLSHVHRFQQDSDKSPSD